MTTTATRAPYVGPQPFGRKDARRFFGREAEIRVLLSCIVASRVVVLYAPSGAGKTSLLNAGVIPLLEQEEQFEVLPPARVRGFAADESPPTDAPNMYVYNALVHWSGDGATRRDPVLTMGERGSDQRRERGSEQRRKEPEEPVAPGTTLQAFLEGRTRTTDRRERPLPRALVFDQFEEIFTAYPELWEQREQFFRQVGDALAADPYLRVVLALREDHLAELLAYVDARPPLFPEPIRFRLERLRRDAALVAITRPLEGTGRAFAPGVAEHLVDDLLTSTVEVETEARRDFTGEFVEPMHLQLAGQSLWENLRDEATKITDQDLLAFGDVDQVLSRYYGDAVAAAATKTGVDESKIRVWVDQSLITEMDTRNTVYRARDKTAGMENGVIDVLERKGLIRRDPRSGAVWYELTHDRFIKPIRASNRKAQADFVGWSEEEQRGQPADQALARAADATMKGRYEEALSAAEEALRLYEAGGDDRGVLNALHHLGNGAYMLERYDESLEYLHRAQAVADRSHDIIGAAEVQRSMGYTLFALGDGDDAIIGGRRAAELFAAGGETASALHALLDVALMCGYSDREDEAEATLATAAERTRAIADPEDRADFLRTLAQTYTRLLEADASAAVSAYEAAWRAYASLSAFDVALEVLLELVAFQMEREDYEGAARACTQGLELAPGDRNVLHERAAAYWYDGHYDEALADFTRIIDEGGGTADAYSARGQVLAEQGDFGDAIEDLERAIVLATGSTLAYARNGLGLALGGLGQFGPALESFAVSLELEPHNAWAYFNRALTYERMGDEDRALADYEQSLAEGFPPLNRWRSVHAQKRLVGIRG